jgi:hypothetical protein
VTATPRIQKSPTQSAARLAAEVMAVFVPVDERENGFEVIHLHGFIDAYDDVRAAGLDPHELVEGMLLESPYEKVLADARRVIETATIAKKAKQ